jgi:hypothetical protein
MAKSQVKTVNEPLDPYSIKTDNGDIVNTQTASPNLTIKIHGHRIKVRDIPITAATLDCEHTVRGIAFAEGNLVYCDKHESGALRPSKVVSVT